MAAGHVPYMPHFVTEVGCRIQSGDLPHSEQTCSPLGYRDRLNISMLLAPVQYDLFGSKFVQQLHDVAKMKMQPSQFRNVWKSHKTICYTSGFLKTLFNLFSFGVCTEGTRKNYIILKSMAICNII